MTQHQTELTVVIPSKDRPARLIHAVRSVLSQLVAGDCIVIVDDASTPPAQPALRAALTESENAAITVLRNDVPQRPPWPATGALRPR